MNIYNFGIVYQEEKEKMHWSDIDQIVESLEEMYADEDIPVDDLPYLHEMVLSIAEFEDREISVDDAHLKVILESWLDNRDT